MVEAFDSIMTATLLSPAYVFVSRQAAHRSWYVRQHSLNRVEGSRVRVQGTYPTGPCTL